MLLAHQRATATAPYSALFSGLENVALAQNLIWSIQTNDLFLVWNGKPLNEEYQLADYNISADATVMVSYRNRGGCLLVSFSILVTICLAIIASTCTCGISLLVVPLLLPLLFILPLFCL